MLCHRRQAIACHSLMLHYIYCLPFIHDVVLCYVTAGKRLPVIHSCYLLTDLGKHNELGSPPDWVLAAKLRQALTGFDVVVIDVRGALFE